MCSRTRGPAIAPSFVTCPTRKMEIPAFLPKNTSRAAHSRTCPTEPGAPARSGENTVWIESMIITAGASSAAGGEDPLQGGFRHQVDSAVRDPEAGGAQLHLRLGLLPGDVQHRSPLPRQPPRRLQEDGGFPDPRVAAQQGGRRGHHASPHHAVELGDAARDAHGGGLRDLGQAAPASRPGSRARRARRPGAGAETSSTKVFHSPHPGHFPTHFGDVVPHAVQANSTFTFAIFSPPRRPPRRTWPRRRGRSASRPRTPAPARTEPSGSVASFTRTRPKRVSTSRTARSSFSRSQAWYRRPIAVDTEKTAEETSSSRSSGARIRSTQPGRFFFIVAGRTATSRAPALEGTARSAARTAAGSCRRCSPRSRGPGPCPAKRPRAPPRRPAGGWGGPGAPGAPARSRRARAVISGGRSKETSKARRSAAPVGVTSSPSPSPNRHGAPFSSSRVAGAGTGIFPCSDRASPLPPGSGRTVRRLRPGQLEQEAAGDDVDDRVDGAHLVEVDLVDRRAVDLRLGRPQQLEAADRPCERLRRQGGGLEQRDDVGEMARVLRPAGHVHVHPRPRHPAGVPPLHRQPVAGERERP